MDHAVRVHSYLRHEVPNRSDLPRPRQESPEDSGLSCSMASFDVSSGSFGSGTSRWNHRSDPNQTGRSIRADSYKSAFAAWRLRETVTFRCSGNQGIAPNARSRIPDDGACRGGLRPGRMGRPQMDSAIWIEHFQTGQL